MIIDDIVSSLSLLDFIDGLIKGKRVDWIILIMVIVFIIIIYLTLK